MRNPEQIIKTEKIESAIIADILSFPSRLVEYNSIINQKHFYSQYKQAWFQALERQITVKGNYNAFNLIDQLAKDKRIQAIHKENIHESLEIALEGFYGERQTGTIDEKAKVLLEGWMKRKAFNQAQKTLKALAAGEDIFDIIETSQQSATAILSEIEMKEQTIAAQEDDFIQKLLNGLSIVPSAFSAVNDKAPYAANELHIIGARPGAGKTARMLADALHAAQAGFKVAIFTAEMSESQLIRRFVYYTTGIPTSRMRLGFYLKGDAEKQELRKILLAFKGEKKVKELFAVCKLQEEYKEGMLDVEDFRTIVDSFQDLKKLPIFIKYETNFNRIKSTSIAWNQRYGIDIIFIDYLSLLSVNGRFQNEEQRIGTISRESKKLAGQNQANCPVVMLSQLSRKCEDRHDKKPIPSDLRYSGAIEQDADVITLLFRAKMYFEEPLMMFDDYAHEDVGEFIVAKNREGSTGPVFVDFKEGKWISDLMTEQVTVNDSAEMASARPNDDDIPF